MKKRKWMVVIAFLLLSSLAAIITWVGMTPVAQARRTLEWSPGEKRHVIERMKHHGITACIQDEQGYYFIRAGQRCRL
jgi:hypothetical protein